MRIASGLLMIQSHLLRRKDKAILAAVCSEKGISVTLVAKLLDTERQMDGMSRRAGIQSRIDEIFHEDWRLEEEVRTTLDNSSQQ